MDNKLQKIGRKLRTARGGMSLRRASELCEVTENTMEKYEAGERLPESTVMLRIADCYGVSVQELFYDD